MTLPIPASEVAVGDYSPDYGTVKQVKKGPERTEITFKNGKVLETENETELFIDQGGRF